MGRRYRILHAGGQGSGIMMRLRIVKAAKNEEERQDERDNIPHGTKVMKELVMPWANTDRIICADS